MKPDVSADASLGRTVKNRGFPPRVKIVICGFGSSGRRFLSLVKSWNPLADILVYSSQVLEPVGHRATKNLDDVTAFDPDLAIVCGSATARVEVITALTPTLRGLFVEKPVAADLRDAEAMLSTVDHLDCVVQVGYNLRFSESLRDFKRRVTTEELGAVHSVRVETGQFLPTWRPQRDYQSTVSAQAARGGGVLLELSHEIDYVQWIWGPIEWVSAFTGLQSELEIDVEDTAHLVVGFPPERNKKQIVGQLNLDFVRHDHRRTVTALCANGSLRWDGVAGRAEVWAEGSGEWETVCTDDPGGSTYDLEWHSFIAAVENSQPPEVSLEEGVSVVQVIEAARISASAGGSKTIVAAIGMEK